MNLRGLSFRNRILLVIVLVGAGMLRFVASVSGPSRWWAGP